MGAGRRGASQRGLGRLLCGFTIIWRFLCVSEDFVRIFQVNLNLFSPLLTALPQVSWSLRAGHQVLWAGRSWHWARGRDGRWQHMLVVAVTPPFLLGVFSHSSGGRKWSHHSWNDCWSQVPPLVFSSWRQTGPWVPAVPGPPFCSSPAPFPLQAPGEVGMPL